MTLNFPDKDDQSPLGTQIYLDGDYSGVTTNNPLGYQRYRVQLVSKYNLQDIEQDGDKWKLEATLLGSNERWTNLEIVAFVGDFSETVKDTFRSGYYDFKLWGTYLNNPPYEATPPYDDFEAWQWIPLYEQECKVKTSTTHDMQRGDVETTIKYKTEPNTAKSYVIYNQ